MIFKAGDKFSNNQGKIEIISTYGASLISWRWAGQVGDFYSDYSS